MCFHAYLNGIFNHTGYLEQGLLIRDGSKILALYFRSVQFKLDVASILPLDYAFQMITWQSAPYLRCFEKYLITLFHALFYHEKFGQ